MSAKDAAGLVIGGEPRIDFLPPEVKERKNARKARRGLIVLVVLVMVACAGGYVFATSLAVQSQEALADEQAETQRLIQEQAQYAEARTANGQITAITNARMVGMANEVLWANFLNDLNATLPSSSAITSVSIDSIGAFEDRQIAALPLQGPRIATLSVRALAPDLPTISLWLDNLRNLPGFADAWVTPAQQEGDGYSVEVALGINAEVFEKRFSSDYEAEAASLPSPEDGDVDDELVSDAHEDDSIKDEG